MKLFQARRDGSLWCVYAVSANGQEQIEVSNARTADENFAKETAAALNQIAATHDCDPDEAEGVDLTTELDVPDPPKRKFRLRD